MSRGLTLANLPVVAIDCQTTGATPRQGRLLEVAWSRFDAGALQHGEAPEVTSLLVAQPCGEALPRRIQSLTGIGEADLATAVAPGDVWRRLLGATTTLEGDTTTPRGPVVAHFARFERSFLTALHGEHGGGEPFPLDLLCTHEMVCRLMPGLPRRGLRAVAGRLGHVMEEAKRAGGHVRATAVVWAALVRRLSDDLGIQTLAELRTWMEAVPAVRRTGRDYALSRAKRLGLPEAPGTYRMVARDGRVLYLGKAASLRRRVNSYFQKRRHAAERTPEMLTQVHDVDVTVAGSAVEAALQEVDEIKRLSPPYNVLLKPRPERDGWTPDADCGLAALRDLLDDRGLPGTDARWPSALGVAVDVPIDERDAREGLAAFAHRYDLSQGRSLCPRTVAGLGARLWRFDQARRAARPRKRLARRRRARGAVDRTVRDARRIVAMLENTVLRFAHRRRRVRWFRRLQASALRWTPAGRLDEGPARQLTVEQGVVAHAEDVSWGASYELVRCPDRDPVTFDAATHDRLRVLTTEVRRLVGAGRAVELRLEGRAPLGRVELARRLYWL